MKNKMERSMQFLAGWPWGVFETTGWECWRHPLFFHGRIIVAAMIAAVFHFMSEKERRIWASNPFPSCFSLQTLSGYWFNFNLFECFICKKPFQKFSWFWVWKPARFLKLFMSVDLVRVYHDDLQQSGASPWTWLIWVW
jgi:hypothetical protein